MEKRLTMANLKITYSMAMDRLELLKETSIWVSGKMVKKTAKAA